MFTPERRAFRLAAAIGVSVLAGSVIAANEEAGRYGLGEPISKAELEAWDIDVPPSGEGLPDGSGSVAEGKAVYEAQCVSCHGADGKSGAMDRLVGGQGSLDSDDPVKTVGSYWPYATTLYDYIHRTMPFTNPQSLSADEVYAVTAYVLHLNGILDEDATLDKSSLPAVKMPNRGGFTSPDPRPDVSNKACMSDCPVE